MLLKCHIKIKIITRYKNSRRLTRIGSTTFDTLNVSSPTFRYARCTCIVRRNVRYSTKGNWTVFRSYQRVTNGKGGIKSP